jgi:N utilization substance protein A
MNKIRYDINIIKYISLFETLVRVNVKDCIDTNPLTFVVEQNYIGRAIGKNGVNVKRLERMFNRKIKILEFNPEVLQFVKNVISPLKGDELSKKDNTIIINVKDNTTKALLIGRESQNLIKTTEIIKRYFEIDDIKIV